MEVYRCRFCGETHLGLGPITNCPFCGAHARYMVPIKEWKEENEGITYNDISKKNLEIALDVEVGNASFYKSAAKNAQSTESQGIFKRLSKVELEHAEVFSKLLNVPLPDFIDIQSSSNDKENFEESLRREQKAIEHYAKSAGESAEGRIKEIFSILMEVESDHLRMDKQHLGLSS